MSDAKRGTLHGYLIVDKPAGWTSHDVVSRIRRLTGERKVGHAGTLDPAATGVLPVAVGIATKSLEYLSESDKTYLAEITFGVSTDSYDVDGRVTAVANPSFIDEMHLRALLRKTLGSNEQTPPMHSAVRFGGRRLYEYARRGIEVERTPRPIVIFEIELVNWTPPVASVLIRCSKGTYVRSIARDLGISAGCGAYLSGLVRVQSGPFTLDDAWTLAELESIDLAMEWPLVAAHPDAGAQSLEAVVVDEASALDWLHGKRLSMGGGSEGRVRLYDDIGDWLGIGRGEADASGLIPDKVVTDVS